MTISQRAEVEGVVCDVVCTGRFYDFLEKRKGAGAWCCAASPMRRTASIRSSRRAKLVLDRKLLAQFPEGYRHLAYLQSKIGYTVKTRHARPRRAGARGALCQGRGLAEGHSKL